MLKSFFKKEETLKGRLHAKVKDILKRSLEISHLIIPRRTLLTSEKFFIDMVTDYIIWLYSQKERDLLSVKSDINADNLGFLYRNPLSPNIIAKCFNADFISPDLEKVWENMEIQTDDFPTFLRDLDKSFDSLDDTISSKIKDEAYYLFQLSQYQYVKLDFVIMDSFFILQGDDVEYVYTTKENLDLSVIRAFSFYIKDSESYKIIVLSNYIFSKYKAEIEKYKNSRVSWLWQIKNPYLRTYLCNSMTNLEFGDLNITYFYWDESNPDKVNASVRYKSHYRMFNFNNIYDFDLNLLDGDIITLGWRLSWVVTVTNVKVGRFTYRVLILRKSWTYFLNFRKVEGIPYEVEDLEERSWVPVRKYLIPEDNSNPMVWFDVNREMKHFDIDFPLGYQQEDVDMIFSKLVSSTKWTFWLNWKTNSWKSTSLKNILKEYYEYERSKWINKNILMIENPIEWFDYYLKQVEVDDEDIEDYKSIIMWVKRADLDMCIFGELRTFDVFGVFNEISASMPVVSTFHVWTAEAFLSMLKYYSDKSELNWKDVFWMVNASIVQMPLTTEQAVQSECLFYKPEEKDELLHFIYSRFRLNNEELIEQEKQFKELLTGLVDKMFRKWKYPLKEFTSKAKPVLYYEILTGDMLSMFLAKEETEFGKIYRYLGYTNNMLYKTFLEFIEWRVTFEQVKMDDYSFDVRLETLRQLSIYLDKI